MSAYIFRMVINLDESAGDTAGRAGRHCISLNCVHRELMTIVCADTPGHAIGSAGVDIGQIGPLWMDTAISLAARVLKSDRQKP